MSMNEFWIKVKNNLKSGITVSLVSIPLSVSLAVASQTSPIVGIITAIWGGLLAGFFGGSNYNIVGPTGALSGILATYSLTYGAGALSSLAIITGIIILIAYFFHLEKYLVYIPQSAVEGFTLGVAFVIGLGQLNSAFGIKVTHVHKEFFNNLIETFKSFHTYSLTTAITFIIFLIGLFIFAKYLPKLPGAIMLTPVGILLGYLSLKKVIPLTLLTLGEKYPTMSAKIFTPWTLTFPSGIYMTSFTVALIAVIETMLSAKIADGMTKTKHNKSREMLGCSLANIVSGLFGGIPATAALARTTLNIKTGATDRISAVISSFSIIIISFVLLPFFKYVPMAVIASILIFTAIRMVDISHFTHMYHHDKIALFISFLVASITIYTDPIYGILIGSGLSLLLFMNKLSEGQFEVTIMRDNQEEPEKISNESNLALQYEDSSIVYTIKGQLAYINSFAHIKRFESMLKGNRNIVLRLRELYYIDLDGVEALEEMLELCKKNNSSICISGVNPTVLPMARLSDNFREIEAQSQVLERTSDALRSLGVEPEEV